MRFATKKKDSTTPISGNGNYLRRFKPGETRVRFLDEIDEWFEYREHRSIDGKSFPCTGDALCPGCTNPDEKVSRAGRRYATNLLLVDRGIVLPYVIPVTLASKMETRAQRNDDSVVTRDYVVIRKGTALDTEYDVDADEKYYIDLSTYESTKWDIESILAEMFAEVWGDVVTAAPEPPKQRPARSTLDVMKQQAQDDDPPSKPEVQSESADAEAEHEVTEAELRGMTLFGLMKLAADAEIDFPDDITKPDLLTLIMSKAS